MLLTSTDIASLAQLACLLEASAPKPGNVSPGLPFRDMRYEDFLMSAVAIGPALERAGEHPLGTSIRTALQATRRWTQANTNLGIVLLLAPLARAAMTQGRSLRERLGTVLADTTVEDAIEVYAAIREVSPSGMGQSETQDLSRDPTVCLRDTMLLAANRDAIAREYVSDFSITFELSVPALQAARRDGLDWPSAAVETFLAILGAIPDTLIARKLGPPVAEQVSARAREVAAAGGIRTDPGRQALARFDADLRDAQNSRNPGTTADLTAAAIFVAMLEGGRP